MDDGYSSFSDICMIRLVNGEPYINKNQYIYNGFDYELTQISPYSSNIYLDSATNGMQYTPEQKLDSVSQYDARYIRSHQYSYSGDLKYEDPKINARKYTDGGSLMNDSAYGDGCDGCMNIGAGFNLNLMQSKREGNGVDSTLLSSIKVGSNAYPDTANQNDDYFLTIDPNTGFMIEQKRDTTVYLFLSDEKTLPFPEFDKIGKQLIPFYNLRDTRALDRSIYGDEYGFIN